MNRMSKWCVSAFLPMSVGVVLAAQAPALDVKMGLWEITSVGDYGGQVPTVDMSKMTPQQKAMMDDAMKNMMGQHTTISKSCVTKEKLEKSVFMMDNQPDGQACTQRLTNNTRSALDATVTCTGQQPMTGQMHIDALSSTAIKGMIKLTGAQQGRTATLNMAMTGKWIGADCGKEK